MTELTAELIRLSEQCRLAHIMALNVGDKSVATELIKMGHKIAELIVMTLRAELADEPKRVFDTHEAIDGGES